MKFKRNSRLRFFPSLSISCFCRFLLCSFLFCSSSLNSSIFHLKNGNVLTFLLNYFICMGPVARLWIRRAKVHKKWDSTMAHQRKVVISWVVMRNASFFFFGIFFAWLCRCNSQGTNAVDWKRFDNITSPLFYPVLQLKMHLKFL